MDARRIVARARAGQRLDEAEALALADCDDLELLAPAAEELTLAGFGRRVGYSPKVFIPLTQLCRDVCHYCTFARAPRKGERAFMTLDEVLAVARAGAAAGCREALFTIGDKPELRYAVAREELAALGYASTLDYLAAAAQAVHEQTGLLPHLNPGVMTRGDVERLRPVSVSMGLMLESASGRLMQKGMPHHRSPDKHPAVRLATLQAAGEAAVPFTSGILIGIGETRRERIESLLAIRASHEAHGHVQEVIVQNFRAKPGTRMKAHPEPSFAEHLWTIAVARLALGARMSIQAPPNLAAGELGQLVRAGVNDWGGVSPVTPDHVNPEAPWPHLVELADATAGAGRALVPRLAIAPAHALDPDRWVDAGLRTAVLRGSDASGYARRDGWHPGTGAEPPLGGLHPTPARMRGAAAPHVREAIARARRGEELPAATIAALFESEGADYSAITRAADELRAEVAGGTVTYVVNRNINYTNVCSHTCGFCAFAKGRSARSLRGPAYDIGFEEIARRTVEARARGATEVCLQGGIHPHYTGETYLGIVRAVKDAVPSMHVHAFSPLEVTHGARSLGLSLAEYLATLRDAGLRTLPGTAAEILHDDVRAIICPDKVTTAEWLDVMRAAHGVGLRSTATIMFGHVERPIHWAHHLLAIRRLQAETGGFTEFVPLPFVHMEAPMWRRGRARSGPTFREAVLMHAIARLALHPLVPNVQTSWVKMGPAGAAVCLQAGANDLGGTLMNESITRAAGGAHGQEQTAESLAAIARQAGGRELAQRTTLYGRVGAGEAAAA